jgi:preprotein translocase subunit SecF
MGKFSRFGNDLYNGHRTIDFVGRRGLWYAVSLVMVTCAIAIVLIKGLNYGIEFTGGTQYRVPLESSQVTQSNADAVRAAVAETGIPAAGSPSAVTSGDSAILVQTEALTPAETDRVAAAIRDTLPVAGAMSQDEIGASWGREVAQRAGLGVAVFLVLVMLFIWGYFREWKMSVAAVVALFHDILITVGIYALSGFQVTPSAVTGLLAILGFSLYDTVVVFDKVRENTTQLRRPGETYRHAANLAVNQTLVRSINTGIVALIPIGAILYVSVIQLGASSLQDLALSQFVGMAVGVYSSIALAPRVLVHLKSSEKAIAQQERRAAARARQVDPYASVPAFADDMPVHDAPTDDARGERVRATGATDADLAGEPAAVAPRAGEPTGRGRTAPPARGPVRPSGAAGRAQPSRQTRSKRGKK